MQTKVLLRGPKTHNCVTIVYEAVIEFVTSVTTGIQRIQILSTIMKGQIIATSQVSSVTKELCEDQRHTTLAEMFTCK